MDKWYLSDNGDVNGPFNIADVETLVSKNSDLYGWNPSFNHWLPVVQINEFESFLPQDKESNKVSKDLIDKFVSKKRDLNKKINLIDNSVESTTKSLGLFEKEIADYKELTKNLNADVQDNIAPLEKKYNTVKKQLGELQKAAEIAKQEIDDVVKEFGDLVLSKTSNRSEAFAELAEVTATVTGITKDKVSIESNEVDEVIPSVQPIKNVASNVSDDSVITKDQPTSLEKAAQLNQTIEKPVDTKDVQPEEVVETPQVGASTIGPEKKGFSDVKNKLKSVFGNSKPEPTETKSLSEQMMQLEKGTVSEVEEDEEIVFIDSDVEPETNSVEETPGDEKKKRRRRRRF
jgi:hypothetical protein